MIKQSNIKKIFFIVIVLVVIIISMFIPVFGVSASVNSGSVSGDYYTDVTLYNNTQTFHFYELTHNHLSSYHSVLCNVLSVNFMSVGTPDRYYLSGGLGLFYTIGKVRICCRFIVVSGVVYANFEYYEYCYHEEDGGYWEFTDDLVDYPKFALGDYKNLGRLAIYLYRGSDSNNPKYKIAINYNGYFIDKVLDFVNLSLINYNDTVYLNCYLETYNLHSYAAIASDNRFKLNTSVIDINSLYLINNNNVYTSGYDSGFSSGVIRGSYDALNSWDGFFPSLFGSIAHAFMIALDIDIFGVNLLSIIASFGVFAIAILVIRLAVNK